MVPTQCRSASMDDGTPFRWRCGRALVIPLPVQPFLLLFSVRTRYVYLTLIFFYFFFCFVVELTDYCFHLVPSEGSDEAQIIKLDVSVCMYL